MLVFITSLRHPYNCHSYAAIEALLRDTLRSVCAQTCEAYRVIVVGNQVPAIAMDPTKVEFVLVDFPPPSTTSGPCTGIQAVRLDKGTKLAIGLIAARKYVPNHVMFFDADDRVSNRLAAHVQAHPEDNGWYLEEGYTFSHNGSSVRRHRGFNLLCGTSHIVRHDLFEVPLGCHEAMSQDALLTAFGERFVRNIVGCHMTIAEYFHALDAPLSPFPFPGAIWVINTGENHSGSGAVSFGRPLSTALTAEFALWPGSVHWLDELLVSFKSLFARVRRRLAGQ